MRHAVLLTALCLIALPLISLIPFRKNSHSPTQAISVIPVDRRVTEAFLTSETPETLGRRLSYTIQAQERGTRVTLKHVSCGCIAVFVDAKPLVVGETFLLSDRPTELNVLINNETHSRSKQVAIQVVANDERTVLRGRILEYQSIHVIPDAQVVNVDQQEQEVNRKRLELIAYTSWRPNNDAPVLEIKGDDDLRVVSIEKDEPQTQELGGILSQRWRCVINLSARQPKTHKLTFSARARDGEVIESRQALVRTQLETNDG